MGSYVVGTRIDQQVQICKTATLRGALSAAFKGLLPNESAPLPNADCHAPTSVVIAAASNLADHCPRDGMVAAELASAFARLTTPGQVIICDECQSELIRRPMIEYESRAIGEHIVSDDIPAIPMYQLDRAGVPKDFPPLPSQVARRDNLVRRWFPFIGRRTQIADLAEILQENRLVTIVGEAGIGKSSLAWRIGIELRQSFPAGIWMLQVELNDTCESLSHSLSNVIGRDVARVRSPDLVIREAFQKASGLVVLDGCDKAREGTASFVKKIVADCPNVALLQTSRTELGSGINGVVYELGPMGVSTRENPADKSAGTDDDAVDLVMDRLEVLTPQWTPTPEDQKAIMSLCKFCRGNPSELLRAAQIASVRGIRALCDELTPARGQFREIADAFRSLRGIEVCQLAPLGVLCGDWPQSAASAVVDKAAHLNTLDWLGALSSAGLLEAHFAIDGQIRYRFQDAVSTFLLSNLSEVQRLESEARHALHYLEVAENCERQMRGADLLLGLQKIDREYQNIVIALGRMQSRADSLALRIVVALAAYWQRSRPVSEWGDLSAAAIEMAMRFETPIAARALNVACTARFVQGDFSSAFELAERTYERSMQCGDVVAKATATSNWALTLKCNARLAEATIAAQQAVEFLRNADEPRRLGATLINLGSMFEADERFEDSVCCYREAHAVASAVGDSWTACRANSNIAESCLARGQIVEAVNSFKNCLRQALSIGDEATIAFSLEGIGMSYAQAERLEMATTILGSTAHYRENLQLGTLPNWTEKLEATSRKLEHALGHGKFESMWEAGSAQDVNEIVTLVIGGCDRQ